MLMTFLQAMAFMSRYRKLMQNNVTYLEPAQIAEEVDYNFGRAFHGLGERILISLIQPRTDPSDAQVSCPWL